jgi:hypothetical protein
LVRQTKYYKFATAKSWLGLSKRVIMKNYKEPEIKILLIEDVLTTSSENWWEGVPGEDDGNIDE